MSDHDSEIGLLADEFVERARRGENPTISEYVRRRPDLEAGIREVFPLLYVMEDVKPELPTQGTALEELGDYKLLRVIGRGGMGVVYEAEQKTLGRRVALKVLPPGATLDERFKARFFLEARAAAKLQHPNIVPVIGSGEHDGTYYFTMQFIDGRGLDVVVNDVKRALSGDVDTGSLGRRLLDSEITSASTVSSDLPILDESVAPSQRPVPAMGRVYYENVARIGLQAANALAYAHAQGVLHRDVKPSNILLDRRGHVWIADFGLAKEMDSEGLTATGDVLGTFRYMPPERFQGESDVQSDVYGLGITLHELLTRKPAYADQDKAALAARILREAPKRPRAIDPKVPAELDAIVGKAVAHDRKERYATAEALAGDLRAFLEGRPITARSPTIGYLLRVAIRKHKALAATIATAIAVLVASTVWYVLRVRAEQASARFNQYTTSVAAASAAILAFDRHSARRLLDEAPVEYRGWEWKEVRGRLDQSLQSVVLEKRHPVAGATSPDGRWIVLASPHKGPTCVLDATTLEVERELPGLYCTHTAWSPRGDRIAFATRDNVQLWRWPACTLVRTFELPRSRNVGFLGEGSRLVAGGEGGFARIWDLASGELIRELRPTSPVLGLDTHPTRDLVLTGGMDGQATVWSAATGEPLWTKRIGKSGLHQLVFVGEDLVAASAKGIVRILGVEDGREVAQLALVGPFLPHVRSSPDGKQLAVSTGEVFSLWDMTTFERQRVYMPGCRDLLFHPTAPRVVTLSADGLVESWYSGEFADPARLLGHIDDVPGLAVDPQGRWVVTCGFGTELRVWDASTGEHARTLFAHHIHVQTLDFDTTGALLASADAYGHVRIWDVASWTVRHRLEAPAGSNTVAFSPDGTRLLLNRESGWLDVWDVSSGASVGSIRVTEKRSSAMAVANRKPWVVVSDEDGLVSIWDIRTLKKLREYRGHTAWVTDCAFDATDCCLATLGHDRTLRLWRADAEDDSPRILKASENVLVRSFLSVAFSPDGKRIAAGTYDGKVHLFDTERDREVATYSTNLHWVYKLGFHPDGSRLYAATSLAVVKVFHTQSSRELSDQLLQADERSRDARPLVERLRVDAADLEDLLRRVEAADVPAERKEAARRIVHRERGTRRAMKNRAWRALSDPAADAERMREAAGLAHNLNRAAWHRAEQDSEVTTLFGIARYRRGRCGLAIRTLTDATRQHRDDPEMLAIDLVFLASSHAGRPLEIAKLPWPYPWWDLRRLQHVLRETRKSGRTVTELIGRLEALLEDAPEARTPRVERFLAEARASGLDLSGR